MEEKRIAARSAVSLITHGMKVGIGTGSTVAFAIEELGRRVKEGLNVICVPTSKQSEERLKSHGVPVMRLREAGMLDVCIDGADQVDRELNLLKGGWGAHTMEKIVASSSERFIIIVDESKLCERLNKPVPLEIIPEAIRFVERRIGELGGKLELRRERSELGNLLADAHFGEISDVPEMDRKLSCIPGIVEHGIFPCDMVSEVHVGTKKGAKILKK